MKFEEGPIEMLAALASGDPERIAFAKVAQAELFKERHGFYLHEMVEVCPECQEEQCPIWAPLRAKIADHWDDREGSDAAREQLRREHAVLEHPCVTCGLDGAVNLCNIFYCYTEGGREHARG